MSPFTEQMLEALRQSAAKIETVDPDAQGYRSLVKMLDGLSQSHLKQIANARIRFLSALASNRIKEKA